MLHLILLALLLIFCGMFWWAIKLDSKGIRYFEGPRLTLYRIIFWILLSLNLLSFWVWWIKPVVA